MIVKLKSSHTKGQLRIGCGELIWLSGDECRRYFACVNEIMSNYHSRRDVILDLNPIVLISLDAVDNLLQLKATLAAENRNLALVNLRPLAAEMLRSISASDLLNAGRTVLEEPSRLCVSETSL
jgi:hypothetical protein